VFFSIRVSHLIPIN